MLSYASCNRPVPARVPMIRTCTFSVMLTMLLGFALVGCRRNSEQVQQPQATTSSLRAEFKSISGVVLPESSTLIKFENQSHLDEDAWLFKLNDTNTAQYPKQLNKLFIGSEAASQAELLERIGSFSIKDPTACYTEQWDWSGVNFHAMLISTTADGSYLMITRINHTAQQGNGSTTNR